MTFRPWLYLAGVSALAAVYFAAAKLGFTLAFVDVAEQVTLVWPPTGIALAALLLFGYRLWPGVAIGAFVANATANEPLSVAGVIAVGNTLEAVVGAWLLQRLIGFRNPMERLRDVFGLVVLAAGLSTTVSATIGAAGLCWGDIKPWHAYGSLWRDWWLGDAMGDLVMAPVLLTWAAWPLRSRRPAQATEAAALLLGLAAVSALVFTGGNPKIAPGYPLEYTIFPFSIWAALRFGQRGAATATLVALTIAIVGTASGLGPFAGVTTHGSLVQLHLYMAVLAVTALLLGAATAERQTAERRRAVGHAVTAVLAEAPSLASAAPRLLQVVCARLGWDAGALWIIDRSAQLMRCAEVWHPPQDTFAEFEATTRGRTFAAGVGLPGEVWATGQATWIPDVTRHPNFPRGPFAARAGLHGGFGLPIVLGAETLGALEFFSRHVQPRDDDCLKVLAAIGGQIGQFIERRRAEDELRASEEALREADRRKNEFLAMLAHELRNPLAPIVNALHILKMPMAQPAAVAQARELLDRQVQHLVRLVEDLLDVSRIMRGRIELRSARVDLADVIARAVETAQPIIDARGHALTVTLAAEPIAVDADVTRLAQVVANLLNNAAKYTERAGCIWLSTERQDGAAVIRVRDTGMGIAPEVLPHIFDLFVQAERALDRAQNGLGIGLTLARSLVERHGGSVQATSAGLGHGSEFIVRLPVAEEPVFASRAAVPLVDTASGGLPSRRILVVDDNADAANSFALMLRLKGQSVRVAYNGPDALTAAQAEPPDVVFLDLGMPKMNGFEVARRLRQQPGTESVLLVALTGWGQPEDRRRTEEAGFDCHLVKPVDVGAVDELLAQPPAPAR